MSSSKFRCWMIWPMVIVGPAVFMGWLWVGSFINKYVEAKWGVGVGLWALLVWIFLPFAILIYLACIINSRSRTP